MKVVGIILSVIFIVLSFIHLYWAVGGKWAIDKVLPTTVSGTKMLEPGFWGTIIICIFLGSFAWYYLQISGLLWVAWPPWLSTFSGWFIPGLFLLRVIGDFKFVGLFKKVKATPFARMDKIFYIPLCLLIAILGLLINILNL